MPTEENRVFFQLIWFFFFLHTFFSLSFCTCHQNSAVYIFSILWLFFPPLMFLNNSRLLSHLTEDDGCQVHHHTLSATVYYIQRKLSFIISLHIRPSGIASLFVCDGAFSPNMQFPLSIRPLTGQHIIGSGLLSSLCCFGVSRWNASQTSW